MAAAKGNQYAAKERRFVRMLQRVLERPNAEGDVLERVAIKLTECALEGQPWAVQEIANRLDGKSVQPIDHTFEEKAPSLSDALLAYVAQGGKPEDYGKETVQ